MRGRRILATAAAAILAGSLALPAALSWDEVSGPGLLILVYHRVVPDSSPASKYAVPVARFTRQLDLLHERGYRFVGPQQLREAGAAGGERTVMVTFDDGTEDHASIVLPVLETRGVKGLFFVTSDWVDEPGHLSREGLLRLAQAGHGIGSHSLSHRFMDEIGKDELERELSRSKAALETLIGGPVEYFAPPGGWYDDRAVSGAREQGYRGLFSCLIGINPPGHGGFVYRRVTVTGKLSEDGFGRLLSRGGLLRSRVVQRYKYIVHDLLGSTRYLALSRFVRSRQRP